MSRRLPAGNGVVGHDERDDPGRVLVGGALVGGRGRVDFGALHGPADGVVVEPAAAVEDLLLPLVLLHARQVILQECLVGALQLLGLCLALGILRFALLAQAPVYLLGRLADLLGVYGPGLLGGQCLFLVVQLVDRREMGVHLGAQLLRVAVGRLPPHEREPARVGLDLRAVQEVCVQVDHAGVRQQQHHAGEHLLEHRPYARGAEPVHRVVLQRAHAGQP